MTKQLCDANNSGTKTSKSYLSEAIISCNAVHEVKENIVNYDCLQALVNNALTWQSSCVGK